MGMRAGFLPSVFYLIFLYHYVTIALAAEGALTMVGNVRMKGTSLKKDSKGRGALVHHLIFNGNRVGNFLGWYMESLACAAKLGLNFYCTKNEKESRRMETYAGKGQASTGDAMLLEFEYFLLRYFPLIEEKENIFLNNKNSSEVIKEVDQICKCDTFCFERNASHSVWISEAQHIGKSFEYAMCNAIVKGWNKIQQPGSKGQLAHIIGNPVAIDQMDIVSNNNNNNNNNTTSNTSSNMDSMEYKSMQSKLLRLHAITEVSIQVRCSDILFCRFGSCDRYGILPFHAYLHMIPNAPASIAILSDPENRGPDGKQCSSIIKELMGFLQGKYPAATVTLKRGGSVFGSMMHFMYSKVVVCGASSFCIWPALASQSTVYFPNTNLLATGTAPYLTPYFHWIHSPKVMQVPKGTRDVVHFLQALKAVPMGEADSYNFRAS